MILSIRNASFRYGEKTILNNATIAISKGDKVGIIGDNGIGKTTLLEIFLGEMNVVGECFINQKVKKAYLPQKPEFAKEATALGAVLENITKEREMYEYEAKKVLSKFGINDYQKLVSQMSGGEKKRVALAKILVNPVDLLVLDEPTNHLDNEMIAYLEKYLCAFKGTVIMVTHDRYFLQRVVKKIVELAHGKLYEYVANYEKYLELRAAREYDLGRENEKHLAFLRREAEWVKRGCLARTTKSKHRLMRYETVKQMISTVNERKLDMSTTMQRLGKKTIECTNIAYTIDNRTLFSDFNYSFWRQDRLGIIGTNGSGKTTLLRIMAGDVQPSRGTIDIGTTVKIGWFKQEMETLDDEERVIDYIKKVNEWVETETGVLSASQMLERFLFENDMQYNKIKFLSGGEKRRLYLLKVLMTSPNILFLDEPTNDLDIKTLEVLEEFLDIFSGAVVIVSHDRYFLDKTVDHLMVIEDSKIKEYLGGYSDYLATNQTVKTALKRETREIAPTTKVKLSYREEKELESLEETISRLEMEIKLIDEEIVANASDYQKIIVLAKDKEVKEEELATSSERWLGLSLKKDQA